LRAPTYEISGRTIDPVSGLEREWTLALDPLAVGFKSLGRQVRGRPQLVRRILPGFQELHAASARSTAERSRYNMNYLWRFLDELETFPSGDGELTALVIDDLSWAQIEKIWRRFINWLKVQDLSPRMRYYVNYTVYSVFMESYNLEAEQKESGGSPLQIYVYFSDDDQTSYGDDPLNHQEAVRVFRFLARLWANAVTRVVEGRKLAENYISSEVDIDLEVGDLPRRLGMVRELLAFSGLERSSADVKILEDACASSAVPARFRSPFVDEGGVWAHVSVLFFTWQDIAIAYAMVLMKCGMNTDAVARMITGRWWLPDPIYPEKRVVLVGPKRLPGEIQRGSSSIYRRTDPYQVMKKIIEIQSPISERLQQKIEGVEDADRVNQSSLVWMWPEKSGIGDLLPETRNKERMHAFIDKLFVSSDIRRENGRPVKLRFSSCRDIFALFIYQKSGFNYVLTAHSLGQSTLEAVLHHIEKRDLIIKDRQRIIDLQGQILPDLRKGRFSPSEYGDGPKLLRTAVGLGCRDPLHPTETGDPGNPGGIICRSQHCWRCLQWFATIECLPYLSRAIMDLQHIETTLGYGLWIASDYREMLAILEYIVGKFHIEHVETAKAVALGMPPIVPVTQFTGKGGRRKEAV